jgi:hypothetical protein
MTLSSDIYVLDPIEPMLVFRACQELLSKYDDQHRPVEQMLTLHRQDGMYVAYSEAEHGALPDDHILRPDGSKLVWVVTDPDAPWSLDNKPGQDLPAWLMLAYRPGRALRTAEDVAPHDEYCNIVGNKYYDPDEELCDSTCHPRACWLSIDFDTTYGYRDKRGWGCGDLHSALIAELGFWLDARGIRWEWKNEFTGDVYQGANGLETLGHGGAEASQWFTNMVVPAIALDMALNGGGVAEIGGCEVTIPDLSEMRRVQDEAAARD